MVCTAGWHWPSANGRKRLPNFRTLFAIEPKYAFAYFGLGLSEAEQSHYAIALRNFQKVARLEPKAEIAWVASSGCAEKLGKRQDESRLRKARDCHRAEIRDGMVAAGACGSGHGTSNRRGRGNGAGQAIGRDKSRTQSAMSGNAESRIKIFGEHDAATIRQIETCVAADGVRGVLCADGHKGYAQPIGGVVAYRDRISLSGVGFDIACGNLAILHRRNTQRDSRRRSSQIMDDVVRDISFGDRAQKQNASRA